MLYRTLARVYHLSPNEIARLTFAQQFALLEQTDASGNLEFETEADAEAYCRKLKGKRP